MLSAVITRFKHRAELTHEKSCGMSGGVEWEEGEGNFPHQKTFEKFLEHLHEKQQKVEEEIFFTESHNNMKRRDFLVYKIPRHERRGWWCGCCEKIIYHLTTHFIFLFTPRFNKTLKEWKEKTWR
jgi:hypothetical protein